MVVQNDNQGVILSNAKNPKLPAPHSFILKAHFPPVAEDPSLPLVVQDDNHRVILSKAKNPRLPASHSPFLKAHSLSDQQRVGFQQFF
jgi:hypothetical protein